jgi:hypothetical protein
MAHHRVYQRLGDDLHDAVVLRELFTQLPMQDRKFGPCLFRRNGLSETANQLEPLLTTSAGVMREDADHVAATDAWPFKRVNAHLIRLGPARCAEGWSTQ